MSKFTDALVKMQEIGDFDKIPKYARGGYFARRQTRIECEALKNLKIDRGMTIPLLHDLQSADILAEAICIMLGEGGKKDKKKEDK